MDGTIGLWPSLDIAQMEFKIIMRLIYKLSCLAKEYYTIVLYVFVRFQNAVVSRCHTQKFDDKNLPPSASASF